MGLQIAAIILGFGAMFVLGMYVATQIEKGITQEPEVYLQIRDQETKEKL
mgnify:CR=1 FL=1